MNHILNILTFGVLLSTSASAYEKCQLIDNVKGYTPTSKSQQLQQFNWLAFENGKVLATGKKGTQSKYKHCSRTDGQGRFMLPGLIDAHGHVSSLGNEMLRVKLRGTTSEQIAVEKVKEFADKNPGAKWILGRGWNQVLWLNKEFPTKKSLDSSGIKRPILLRRIDGHAAWANSAALAAAGINKSTADPQGGKIIRDENGEATGVLIDNAIGLVEKIIPAASPLEREYAFDKAYEHLLSLGVVSVHDAGVSQADLDSYLKRSRENRLPIRIYGMLSGSSPNLSQWLDKGIIQDKQDFLSIRSVKLYSDGALGSRGAALIKPYSDDLDNKGLLLTKPKKLDLLVNEIIKKGFQANIHAIGDRGNRLVLDAFEKAFKQVGGKHLRNRIEHSQIISLADIPRFKELNIIASMQPVHATSDKNMAGARLGKERLKGAYAWRKLLQQGTIIASGSDFPVELANPFHGLHAAVTRQDQSNMPSGGWLPEERMTPQQALRSFTLDAAYAAHQESTLGSLEAGKWADFIFVDQDIINGKPEDLWKTRVLETWIAGTQRYKQ
ncbi:amidohydrolase [Aliikangiella coralliicola]|uniref:Amidohydrolase n=1 Tax=Aliikangiella coralliicola TaxID=2592383 RepID=A0A545TW56_9GAMM|nr:amidohydrolase [Aliikangiella coralliicola]TQV81445.1 amidohydrolase [Aliikangiella coralliicola]